MRILVTGGAGFIGSHLCEALLREGHAVSILDNLNEYYSAAWKRRNLDAIALTGHVDFFHADIAGERAVDAVFEKTRPEVILHLAAEVGVRPSVERPLDYERTNVGGTLVLLEAARRYKTGKFVFASSSSVYGSTAKIPFREDDPLASPISPYAATKITGEKLCFTYSYLHHLPVVCLRLFTVIGPRQRPDLAIRKFAEWIDRHQPVTIFGEKTARDYTFVGDIVQGFLAALQYECDFDIFNLGNSQPVSLDTVIATLEDCLGKEAIKQRQSAQPGDMTITWADISKAKRALGYAPRTSFADGVRAFVEWYRASVAAVGAPHS